MNKLRIASIGSGWVVSNRHLPALHNNNKFDIVAVVGRQEDRLKELATQYGIPRFYTGDATQNTEWLKDCDAVMIGTDPMSHYRLAKLCLQNRKHVLMEKPFTTSVEESRELVDLANTNNFKLAIVHNFQFSHAALQLDKAIESGIVGEIKGIYALQLGNHRRRLPTWYDQLPWGLFFDESPHLLYLMNKYARGLTLVNAVKFNSTNGLETPAVVTASFRTKIGIPASLYLNFESPISEWYLIIVGEQQLGIVDIFRDIYLSVPNDGLHKPLDMLRTSRHAIIGHLIGTFKSGLRVINRTYLCGNDKVVDIFAEAILTNQTLSPISSQEALVINTLQFELINNAVELT